MRVHTLLRLRDSQCRDVADAIAASLSSAPMNAPIHASLNASETASEHASAALASAAMATDDAAAVPVWAWEARVYALHAVGGDGSDHDRVGGDDVDDEDDGDDAGDDSEARRKEENEEDVQRGTHRAAGTEDSSDCAMELEFVALGVGAHLLSLTTRVGALSETFSQLCR